MTRKVSPSRRALIGFFLAAIFMIWHGVLVPSRAAEGPSGTCPQPRKTQQAPPEFLKKTNPLPATPAHLQAGQKLYMETATPLACAQCHGNKGDGQGPAAMAMVPPPRNFTCAKTMKELPDGQLFWVIKNGSLGTGMMPFAGMTDDEIWKVIQYIRSLAH